MAFRHHRSVVDIAALTVGILLPLLNTIYRTYGISGQENSVNDLAWEIIGVVCAAVVALRLLISPFWVYQELKNEGREQNRKLLDQIDQNKKDGEIRLRTLEDKIVALENPPVKLKIRLDEDHLFDTNTNGAFFWRVDVTSVSPDPIIDCSAYLIKIERNGVEKWGSKKVPLTFEPGEATDSTRKTITPGAREILDVFITAGGAVSPATKPRGWWPYHEQLHTIFEDKGEYVFTIVIEAKNMTACPFQYKFTRDGRVFDKIGINPLTRPSSTQPNS